MGESLKSKMRGAWRSATIWFNTLAFAALPLLDALQAALPTMQQYTGGRIFATFAIIVLVTNILLRFKTNVDLKDR